MPTLYVPRERFGRPGNAVDSARCRAQTYDQVSRNFSQCSRKKVVEADGVGYCKQHSPAAEAERAAAINARNAEDQRRRDRQWKRPNDYMAALREIAEATKKQQIPITSQVYTIAAEALAKWNDLDSRD